MPQQDKVQAVYNSAFAPGEGAQLDLPKKQLQVKGLSLLHSRDFIFYQETFKYKGFHCGGCGFLLFC